MEAAGLRALVKGKTRDRFLGGGDEHPKNKKPRTGERGF